ncbi:hypothetical protein LCGC14_0413600 [marine sediment metagenome]|uniref:Dockerin domain-containing protein n=1 Tax=marine sediment metagenome TaxID=412755 RepID=A0A0F9W243_9ZZZZ
MIARKDVSIIHNRWHDAQRVDKTDMDVEQNRGIDTDAATIHNHFGSGVLLESPEQPIIFDSDNLIASQAAIEAAGNFDGIGLAAHLQPSDINLGNQLEVNLTGSSVIGRLSIKVAIIGLSFDNTVQMDRLYFYKNEKQVTSKHYKRILTIFFNDFKGNNNCSRSLGGRVVIRETSSFQLSTDPMMERQDVSPDLFWRDFKVSDSAISLFDTIQNGMGSEFSADALSLDISGTTDREMAANDVTSQVGQKFQANTDNIQKVTLLIGARQKDTGPEADKFDWTGDIVVSIYPLQTSVSCPVDIVPSLAIDFEPSNEPIAQLSFDQASLEDAGYVLTSVAQPVDFVFSSTKLGDPATSNVVKDRFYAVTIKRSGSATSGTLFLGVGINRTADSRVTLFSGVWVDVPEEDLWFQVWTDAAKIADGRGYDEGNGIQYDKTTTDELTGATIDNQVRHLSFADTGENILNIAVIQAIGEETVTVQDERTGNNVNSRRKFVPSSSFVDESGLSSLQGVSNPFIIGCTQDTNPKQNAILEKVQTIPGLASGDQFCIVNPDPDSLSLNVIGSKLIPNISSAFDYRIFGADLCTDGYGDVNGDGYIDAADIAAASQLIGESLLFNSTQQKIIDGYFSALEVLRADVNGDGYVTATDVDLITQFVNRQINAFPAGGSFTHICYTVQQSTGRYDGYFDCDGYVRLDGYTGLNIIDPGDLSAEELKYDGYLTTPTIEGDSTFTTVPFPGVTYRIDPQPYWRPESLALSSETRAVPATFFVSTSIDPPDCSQTLSFECTDRTAVTPECDPGRNDFLVPDNLIIGKGDIVSLDGTKHKLDFEIGTVILQLPQTPFEEASINLFDKLVADRGDGITRGGLPAMRYSDCTTVQDADFALNRIRFSVSVQAFVPNIDGYTEEDGYGVIVDDIIGVHLDHSTGILKLTIKDLFVDTVFMTLVTKLQILVYLKKAGWNNVITVVEPSQIAGLLST